VIGRHDSTGDRDRIVGRDLIIVGREMTGDRDPKVQPLVTADRDLKAPETGHRDPKVLEIEDRDLIIVGREMTGDRDSTEDRDSIVGRGPMEIEDRKQGRPKVAQPFRRPNLPHRNRQRSRSSSFRRPNPRRPQRQLRAS